jgi:hypothetical protein
MPLIYIVVYSHSMISPLCSSSRETINLVGRVVDKEKSTMQEYQKYPETDPRHYTGQVQTHFDALIELLRQGGQGADEPRAQALFETSAEVLIGLKTAFAHYEQKAEAAWRS